MDDAFLPQIVDLNAHAQKDSFVLMGAAYPLRVYSTRNAPKACYAWI